MTNRAFTAVAKGAPLYEVFDGRGSGDGFLKSQVACYEGLCLGPRNEDGSVNLMLVSDGGAASSRKKLFMTVSVETKPFVRALRMTGLDVCTLAFEPAESGTAGRVGSCYRYLSGSTVSVGLEQSRLARTGSAWTLPEHGLSGEGTNVTFVVTCDDRLHWQSPDALAFSRGRLEGRRPEELARAVAAPERRWQLGAGGFGRGRVLVERDAFRSGRTTVFGPEADLQYGLARHGPYDFRLGLGGAYCPRQGESLRREGPDAARAKTALGYGELRLLAVPQRQVTEDLMLGLRLGVALDWLSAESSAVGGGSDSDTRFAAQGILGIQATWLFTDRLGLYSNLDWRLGGEDEFEARDGESTVDLSGWYWSVGAFVTF